MCLFVFMAERVETLLLILLYGLTDIAGAAGLEMKMKKMEETHEGGRHILLRFASPAVRSCPSLDVC